MFDPSLPFFAEYKWAIGTLIVGLVSFDWLFVRRWPLEDLAWKKVDYVWLSLALLGVIGGVGSARQAAALDRLEGATRIVGREAAGVEAAVKFGVSGAVCRAFERSEYSPPEAEFQVLQRRFDELCAWFGDATKRTAMVLTQGTWPLTIEQLGGRPAPIDPVDVWFIQQLQDQVSRFNSAKLVAQDLEIATQSDQVQIALQRLGPFLLALGLALRVTKVTGEVALARGVRHKREGPG